MIESTNEEIWKKIKECGNKLFDKEQNKEACEDFLPKALKDVLSIIREAATANQNENCIETAFRLGAACALLEMLTMKK